MAKPVKPAVRRNKTTQGRARPNARQPVARRANAKRAPAKIPESIQTHRRGRAINRSASVVAGIFFVFVSVYLIRSFYTFIVTPHIATEVVKIGSIDLPRTVSGIIIRDEYVFTATREGRITFNVSDYERVKPGKVICSIQNVEAVDDINRSMTSIEEQVMALQQMRQDISSVDPAVSRVNTQIKNIVDSKLYNFAALNLPEIYALKESITQSVNTRNQMILDDNINVKEELNVQQQQLLNRLNTQVSYIDTDRGGIMSPIVDNLEGTLTFENRNDLTKEQTQMTVDYDKLVTKKDIKAEDPVFKIIASNIWYIAAYMPNDMIEGFAEGDTRSLYLENKDEYVPVDVLVERLDQGYRESFVLFKCTKNMIDYLNMRNIQIKTSDSVKKGYKISNTAITTRTFYVIPLGYLQTNGPTEQVIKMTGESEEPVPVKVAERDEEYAYILDDAENLALGDLLVKSGPLPVTYELSETMTVQGVYKVNNGFAEFKKITLDAEISATDGYSILNPALNQGIKVYDYIVTDASGVTNEQIIH